LSGKIPRGLHAARGGKMGEVVEVDSKGRIAIPSSIRNKFGLGKGKQSVVEIRGDEIVVFRVFVEHTVEERGTNMKDFLED
jgi:AbrB family looped-hinge helix DNA binding protein